VDRGLQGRFRRGRGPGPGKNKRFGVGPGGAVFFPTVNFGAGVVFVFFPPPGRRSAFRVERVTGTDLAARALFLRPPPDTLAVRAPGREGSGSGSLKGLGKKTAGALNPVSLDRNFRGGAPNKGGKEMGKGRGGGEGRGRQGKGKRGGRGRKGGKREEKGKKKKKKQKRKRCWVLRADGPVVGTGGPVAARVRGEKAPALEGAGDNWKKLG